MPRMEWDSLPEALRDESLAELPFVTRQAARLVCRSWRDNLPIQSVKSDQLNDEELHAICCKHQALRRLNLNNSLRLTNQSLLPLSKLTGLTFLSLGGRNGISDGGRNSLAGLEALEQLRELHVSHMGDSPSAVERVCKLTGLTNLKMSGEGGRISLLDGHLPAHLTNLTNLQCLHLQGIQGSLGQDPTFTNAAERVLRQMLEGLPHLTVVVFRDIFLKGRALRAFQRHTALQKLSLVRCFCVTDLTGLDGLPSLSSLDINPFNIRCSRLRYLPVLTRLRLSGGIDHEFRDPGIPSLSEYFGSPPMLHELVLIPNKVMVTKDMCDDLLQLSQLKVLKFDASSSCHCSTSSQYNWHVAAGLFSHPGLTKLSWTHLSRVICYAWDGEDGEEGELMIHPQDGWVLEVFSRNYARVGGPIMCQVDLAEWLACLEYDFERFDMVFTRCAA